MEWFEQLSRYEYFDEVLIVVGALLVIFGVLKIVGSSLKLLGWVALAGVGALAVMIGMEGGSFAAPAGLVEELRALTEPGKEISINALRTLCERVEIPR